ncbi:RsiV family protein [Hyphobacterium sp.]|uniref:RsiV family protein n=1 Tax=Hyphobacterium sp. TaxID=2004662 RepID=UPI003B51E77C
MRRIAALFCFVMILPPVVAQDNTERISATLPGVYDIVITLDPELAEHDEIHAAVVEAEMESLANLVRLALTDHTSWLADAPEWSWNAYFSETDIDIAFAGRSVISLSRSSSYYTGGAHPNQGFSPVLTRYERYAPVELAEMFIDSSVDSPAMTALFYAVYRELMALKQERLGSDFDESMERDTWLAPLAADPEAFPGFTLIPNQEGTAAAGLMFHFEPYAVGSYAEGPYSVPVPLSAYAGFLAPDWADVFAGEPDLDVLTAPGDALEPIAPGSGE